ncbi:hypothetical protein [Plantactinospora endophytica]|uniref:Arsenate reductase n=1 Tax=Plantactinospora endophytica TaxID=673535 RepID=A0ABQ4EDU1_9ACTN|nr:hypothetical protein [Plantactinospora endophytica]GIG92417.1 hypothetical protein Pen02_73530 [Plantactinospora endophytica]
MADIAHFPSGAVPAACTLPTAEQPLRLAEFDEVLGTAVRSVYRAEPARLRLELTPTPQVAARVADLMVREAGCCSFFAFHLGLVDGRLCWEITVPAGQLRVLDALAARVPADGHRA